jgi:hypothetical protein
MNFSRMFFVVLLGGVALLPEVGSAMSTNMSRRDIRSMPVVQRPSRPGHFYGNAVRRQHYRRQGA